MSDTFNIDEQKKKAVFEERTKGLQSLSDVTMELSNATQRYHADMSTYCKALRFLVRLLEETLDGPPNKIPYSPESHDWLLHHCVKAIDAHATIAEHLYILDPMPFDGTVLRGLAKSLYDILDPEGEIHEAVAIRQHWIEVDLAEEGLQSVKEAIGNLETFLSTKSTFQTKESESDETARSSVNAVGEVDHSPDFRCVYWYGETYAFTPGQANAIKLLWEAWQNKTPYVSEIRICDAAGGDSRRVRDLFKAKSSMHPAIGNMICKHGKDLYFLKPSATDQNPT